MKTNTCGPTIDEVRRFINTFEKFLTPEMVDKLDDKVIL